MGLFDEIDLEKLFDNESEYGKKLTFSPVTEELILRAEKTMGYRIPASYRELLEYRNGGSISDELDNSWLAAIYGISPDPGTWNGLEAMFDNWKNEWEYPDIGIPFGETQSAGHDMYYMDFRVTDENGEPRIVRIDNEFGNEVHYVADNLMDFVRLILKNEEIEETQLDENGSATKALVVTRKKKFASALMPYWIITGVSKRDFMEQYGMKEDLCQHSESGHPISRIDASILDNIGTRIRNGETLKLELEETVACVFASTMDGSLSNEIILDNSPIKHLTLTTKGGFATVSYPVLEQE